ncbi:MAG TPA: CGNR zinc finger domain-containing protein [Candidatus Limnocylindrales bacterium]
MSHIGPGEPVELSVRPRASVDQLLWVANTRHGPGGHWFARVTDDTGDHDHLLVAAEAVDYLARHRVDLPSAEPTAADLGDLGAIRAMIRGLVDAAHPSWTTECRAILDRTRFRLLPDREVRADGGGWQGFIGDLMPPLIEVVARRERLRLCGNPLCRLVFLDSSRNGSRRWCDTTGCGNRARVRRYRRGNAGRPPAGATMSGDALEADPSVDRPPHGR